MPIEKACENCGQTFYCYPSDNRRFCGHLCRSAKRFGKPNVAPGRTVIPFTCRECGKSFGMMQSFLTAYRKKHSKDPMYCSRPCADAGRKKDASKKGSFACVQCGAMTPRRRKPGGRLYAQQKYCSRTCKYAHQRQRALDRFQAETTHKTHAARNGYLRMSVPSLVTGRKHATLEHRWVMEQSLGRPLIRAETVHHINGIRTDNRLENLELFNSRHGPGQRVVDKVQFAIEILLEYPDFGRRAGYELHPITHDVSAAPRAPAPELRSSSSAEAVPTHRESRSGA